MADLYQLRWPLPPGSPGMDAAALACRLHVNPRFGHASAPLPPLVAPMSASVDIHAADLALLVQTPALHGGQYGHMQELLSLNLQRLEVSSPSFLHASVIALSFLLVLNLLLLVVCLKSPGRAACVAFMAPRCIKEEEHPYLMQGFQDYISELHVD